jgi:hypothetical protein
MPSVKYEDAAAAFLQKYPLGTKVRGEDIIAWAETHANGLASDLLIDDDSKKLGALRRHLNTGAASRSFAEDERFVIDVNDAKRKVFTVCRLADYVHAKSEMAFTKSVSGALSPLKQSQKAIEDIKTEELEDAERIALENRMQELVSTMTPLRKVLNEASVNRYVLVLESNGYSKEQALNLVELLPQMQREIKLINSTK